jgi:hypothetical protein
MPEPIPNPADVPGLVALLELEGQASVAMASRGLPPDLTRAPRPEELASRTSYARMEADTLRTAGRLARLARSARGQALDLLAGQLAGGVDVAGVIGQLDQLAAAARTLAGVETLLSETTAGAYGELLDRTTASLTQFLRDAHLAGIEATPGARVTAGNLAALEEQARRLASESVAAALRALRGAAYSTVRAQPVDAFHAAIVARAGDVGTLGLEDIAHQAALRATGEGRVTGMDAVAESGTTFYASELLDRNTCAECSSIDGRDLTRAEADDLYPGGQYVYGAGGGRCRGTVVAVSAIEVGGPAVPFEGGLPDL